MVALERWLEEDTPSHQQDPWKVASEKDSFVHSPTSDTEIDHVPKSLGFDDDFSVFVSAPAGEEERNEEGDLSFASSGFGAADDSLNAAPAGELYHSLGSTPNLSDPSPVVQDKPDSDDEDSGSDGIPTDEEIRAASSRLFGPDFVPPASPPYQSKDSGEKPSLDEVFGKLDGEFDFGNPDYDMASFDLSHVMSALEVMKSEISHMEDEGERRKAAASVALSLVYGLEGQ